MNEYEPDTVSPPGETLTEVLADKQITLSQLAEQMGQDYRTVLDIVHGAIHITPDIALQLEKILDIEADFWITRELDFQISLITNPQKKAFAKRIKELNTLAKEDGLSINLVSLESFITFINSNPDIKSLQLSLTPDGNLTAKYNFKGQKTWCEFLDNFEVKYLNLKV